VFFICEELCGYVCGQKLEVTKSALTQILCNSAFECNIKNIPEIHPMCFAETTQRREGSA
jgi:hypothetical protein